MMPILISSGVMTPGQFGPSSSVLLALHAVARADHVAHRDAFGDADHEIELGVDRFVDRRGGERRRHVDHRDGRAGRLLRLLAPSVDRDAFEVLARPSSGSRRRRSSSLPFAYSRHMRVWNCPVLPVMPCVMTLVFLSTRMLIQVSRRPREGGDPVSSMSSPRKRRPSVLNVVPRKRGPSVVSLSLRMRGLPPPSSPRKRWTQRRYSMISR